MDPKPNPQYFCYGGKGHYVQEGTPFILRRNKRLCQACTDAASLSRAKVQREFRAALARVESGEPVTLRYPGKVYIGSKIRVKTRTS